MRETFAPRALAVVGLAPLGAAATVAILMILSGRGLAALAVLALSVGAVLVLLPRISFYLFMISLAFWAPQRLSATFAIHPFDLMMAIVLAGAALDFLLRSKTEVRAALFDLPFLALISSTVISAILAHNPSYSVMPTVRIVIIYLAFRVSFKFALEIGVRRILLFYLILVAALSLDNIFVFLAHGGQIRAFGLARLGYESMSMTALPMSLAFLLWSRNLREQSAFAVICLVIVLGILATQARGPLLTIVIAAPVLLLLSSIKARRERNRQVVRSALIILISIFALVAAIVGISTTLLAGSWERYQSFIESLNRPQGTIALRLALWQTAIQTFLDHPVIGIGIGNFRIVHDIYPQLKVTPLHLYIKGMSAHNVILHYLAETGLVGALSLLALAGSGLRRSYRLFRMYLDSRDSQVTAALFIATFVFCLTLLYMRAWTWGQGGYIMALLFGLVAAWYRQKRPDSQSQMVA